MTLEIKFTLYKLKLTLAFSTLLTFVREKQAKQTDTPVVNQPPAYQSPLDQLIITDNLRTDALKSLPDVS